MSVNVSEQFGVTKHVVDASVTDQLLVAGEVNRGRRAIVRIASSNWGGGEQVVLRTRLMGSVITTYTDSPVYRKESSLTELAGGTPITADGVYECLVDARELKYTYTRVGGTLTIEAIATTS